MRYKNSYIECGILFLIIVSSTSLGLVAQAASQATAAALDETGGKTAEKPEKARLGVPSLVSQIESETETETKARTKHIHETSDFNLSPTASVSEVPETIEDAGGGGGGQSPDSSSNAPSIEESKRTLTSNPISDESISSDLLNFKLNDDLQSSNNTQQENVLIENNININNIILNISVKNEALEKAVDSNSVNIETLTTDSSISSKKEKEKVLVEEVAPALKIDLDHLNNNQFQENVKNVENSTISHQDVDNNHNEKLNENANHENIVSIKVENAGQVINENVPKLVENIQNKQKPSTEQQQDKEKHHSSHTKEKKNIADRQQLQKDVGFDQADDEPSNPKHCLKVQKYNENILKTETAGSREKLARKSTTICKTHKTATSSEKSLPDIISDIPTATVGDFPVDILESSHLNLNALAVDALNDSQEKKENLTLLTDLYNTKLQSEEQNGELDASEGLKHLNQVIGLANDSLQQESNEQNIPLSDNSNETASLTEGTASPASNDSSIQERDDLKNETTDHEKFVDPEEKENITTKVNLTAEEVPIPVFSEWAQKQMEEAEKQALQQEQSNTNGSTQRKNNTNLNGKPVSHKTHAKNYASPDCGAKIIASNADAVNTGALLSSSSDEYMLNPCGKRNWFVVELCEAIQAQKIHMANFELFSSTPKNFSVSVSNRYPTRDWSNVGRFIAEDKRELQSFDLHPHLFGKFVRVDIFSHYAKEHFCPISLFRVYGTSEFEAFETEDHPHDDVDDFDDELSSEQSGKGKYLENNLFKSASDAVISIVKKAAEVLVKPLPNNKANHVKGAICQTPSFSQFSCDHCNQTLVEKIKNLLSCDYASLYSLLKLTKIQNDLVHSRVCYQHFGIDIKSAEASCNQNYVANSSDFLDAKQSYYLNLLPLDYVGALCHLVIAENTRNIQTLEYQNNAQSSQNSGSTTQPLNLTIDKKVPESFHINKTQEKKFITPAPPLPPPAIPETTNQQTRPATQPPSIASDSNAPPKEVVKPTSEPTPKQETEEQLVKPPVDQNFESTTSATPVPSPSSPSSSSLQNSSAEKLDNSDVNIFNVVPDPKNTKTENLATLQTKTTTPSPVTSEENMHDYMATTTTTESSSLDSQNSNNNNNLPSFEDSGSWENLENLLTSTLPTPTSTAAGGLASNDQNLNNNNNHPSNGNNFQQKIPSNGPQSESIFIRLSNRIKALERNMSLSGQYLEELSRRYKKQVEDLTTVLGQQMQNVRALEDQSRRHLKIQDAMEQRSEFFRQEIEGLKLQIHACILVIIFVGVLLVLFLVIFIIFYFVKYKEVLKMFTSKEHQLWPSCRSGKKTDAKSLTLALKKGKRRKSFDSLAEQRKQKLDSGKSKAEKERRPSEEATLIIKDCSQKKSPFFDSCAAMERQRKVSVFYGDNRTLLNSPSTSSSQDDYGVQSFYQGKKIQLPEDSEQQSTPETKSEYNFNIHKSPRKISKGKKKSNQTNQLMRLESAPATCISSTTLVTKSCSPSGSTSSSKTPVNEYNEKLILDDEDLENFLPTSDLVYNEFMPEGPSGLQELEKNSTNNNENLGAQSSDDKANKKKTRRLSSPAFFKTTFGKGLKIKGKVLNKTPPHESTSWEWHRLSRKSINGGRDRFKDSSNPSHNSTNLDSTSLSEVTFPNTSNENSFRILEEAIMSSGEGGRVGKSLNTSTSNGKAKKFIATVTTRVIPPSPNASERTESSNLKNGLPMDSSESICGSNSPSCHENTNQCNGTCNQNSSAASNSSRSSTSTASSSNSSTKKKIFSLNKIFRKVF